MRLRPFIFERDFDVVKEWITDERTNAMWSSSLMTCPIEAGNFLEVIRTFAKRDGDSPFVATTDDGSVVGFFCYSVDLSSNEGMLRFVIVAPDQRGKGVASEMLALIKEYAFRITKADALALNVYSSNKRAIRCYEKAGFVERYIKENSLVFQEESWDRCNMILQKQ